MSGILVVDDHPTNREYLTTLLGYSGHEVIEATDGVTALQVARQQRPALIIADIVMPKMDGYEFVRQLRSEALIARTPVIFYSAYYLERDALLLAQACGVYHIITKPAEPEVILSTVNAALGISPVATPAAVSSVEFDREHLRLVTDKLSVKVNELEKANRQLTGLIELGQQMAAEEDPPRLLERFCQAARELLGARYAALAIVNGESGAWRHWLTSGMEAETAAQLVPARRDSPEGGLLRTLLAEGRCIRVCGITPEMQEAALPRGHPPIRSFLGARVASPSRAYGSLYVADKLEVDAFNEDDERLMTSLAAVVAVAYENAVRYDEIRRQRAALELEIAERRRAEQVLRDSEQQLRVVADQLARSNQELSDFAAIASHDLREPLRGIYTYASIFLEDHGQKLEGDGRERIDAIMRLARRMYDLTEALLQYSRVGSIDLAWTETDLNRVVAEVLESLEPSLEEHAVSVRIPRPLPAIPCDHVRIGEVFRNLIVNAMKYNDKPQRWIEIAYEMVHGGVESGASDADTTHHSPLTTHVFYVRDNGIGIPAPQREAVFRIFKRLHGGSHFGNGTGAGLTICKKIIERHGGRIWVDSAEGEGSCFCFTLGGHPDVAQPRADFRR